MEISDEMVAEMKELYKKQGKEATDEEAWEAAHNLTNFAQLIYDLSVKEAKRKRRLEKEPDGFPVDGNYTCIVCHNGINETTGWWDLLGPKCLLCQKAIKTGVIPAYVCVNRDSWFAIWQLDRAFKIKSPTARKLIREGKLKARAILDENGKVHEYILLKKENPELVERYSPERKSWDRNRKKESARSSREWAEKMKKDLKRPRRSPKR